MNRLTPYEKMLADKLKQLPLPDENTSWADMKRRLDDERKRRWFIIPFFAGCGLWSILFTVLIGGVGAYFVFFSNRSDDRQTDIAQRQVSTEVNPKKNTGEESDNKKNVSPDVADNSALVSNLTLQTMKDSVLYPENQATASQVTNEQKKNIRLSIKENEKKIKSKLNTHDIYAIENTEQQKDERIIVKSENESAKNVKTIEKNTFSKQQIDSIPNNTITTVVKNDTAVIGNKKTDTLSVGFKKEMRKDKRKEQIYFNAGLAVWQNLDFIGSGAKAISYEPSLPVSSKQNRLLDYLPSLYARMNKGGKWFLQAELRFRAPRDEQNLIVGRKETNAPSGVIADTRIVTKTYYHQFSLGFNYFIAKNWSVGAGLTYNRFNRAVTIEKTGIIIPGFSDSLLSIKSTVIKNADSNFIKSYIQASVETQYRIKRFSFGLNYSRGMQPYLRTTLPGGIVQKEKNSSFRLFLRYELWRQKK